MSTRPAPWASLAVRTATHWLPVGEVRMRYRRELLAELWGLPVHRQVGLALGVLMHSPALTRAVRLQYATPAPHRPLHCRLHLFHRWQVLSTDDGSRYLHCRSCGEDDDGALSRAEDWRTGFSLANRGVY